MRSFVISLLIISLTSFYGFSLKGQVATDTSKVSNTGEYIEGDSSQKVAYNPLQIARLKAHKRIKYRGLVIQGQGFYLEEVYAGKISAYFLDRDDSFAGFYILVGSNERPQKLPVDRDKVRSFLKELLQDCPISLQSLDHFKLKANSLRKLLQNHDKCVGYTPRLRYGVGITNSLQRYKPINSGGVIGNSSLNTGFSFGLSSTIEYPIRASNLSLVSGFNFSKFSSSNTFEVGANGFDMVIDQMRMEIPLGIRYTLFKREIPIFFQTGLSYSKAIKDKDRLFIYERQGGDVSTSIRESFGMADQTLGFMIGAGVIFSYNSNFSYLIQLGYQTSPAYDEDAPTSSENLTLSRGVIELSEFRITLNVLFK